MKADISRKQFLKICALLAITPPSHLFADSVGKAPAKTACPYPATVLVLREAYSQEMAAHLHYIAYSRKALAEHYPNIAYLFSAFSVSEKIHADNYATILCDLGSGTDGRKPELEICSTKKNLQTASRKELNKIDKVYPAFVKRLESESYEKAVACCLYSWKSHRQHERELKRIDKYVGMFFSHVAKKLEGLDCVYYVCGVCGSTLTGPPGAACEICNHPARNYRKISRPV